MIVLAVRVRHEGVVACDFADRPERGVAIGDDDDVALLHLRAERVKLRDIARLAVGRANLGPLGANRSDVLIGRVAPVDLTAPAQDDIVARDGLVVDVILGSDRAQAHLPESTAGEIQAASPPRRGRRQTRLIGQGRHLAENPVARLQPKTG